jgi:signal transduction histidine kinase
LPQQRADVDPRPPDPAEVTDTGGSTLVAHTLTTHDSIADEPRSAQPGTDMGSTARRLIASFKASSTARGIASDVIAVLFVVLDVWAGIPKKADTYMIVLAAVACVAMLIRRRWPFLAVVVTAPGLLVGWSTLAAMIAMGTLARRRQLTWVTWVGASLIFAARFIPWPFHYFVEQTWTMHVHWAIDAVQATAMPIAIGLLIGMRQELSARIAQLAASRTRESKLREASIRAAERALLAREMHDVVSHQVTLIAMQAGALQVSTDDDKARQTATVIRELSTHTLEELRNLVSVLRSGHPDEECQPGLDELGALARDFDIKVTVALEAIPDHVPVPVSQAAYRTVQEALTNVRKHAVGADAAVRVVAQQNHLLVEVRNNPPHELSSDLPSGGHGLIGLRERTGLLGGTFHAGPTPEGGFRVEARYPLTLAN